MKPAGCFNCKHANIIGQEPKYKIGRKYSSSCGSPKNPSKSGVSNHYMVKENLDKSICEWYENKGLNDE